MPAVQLLLSADEKKALMAALAGYGEFCDQRAGRGPEYFWEHAHFACELQTRLACSPVLVRGSDGLDGPFATLTLNATECRVLEDAASLFMADCNDRRSAPNGWDLALLRHRAGQVIERLWIAMARPADADG